MLNSAKPGWAEKLHPSWIPVGFDLVNELPVFVRHFLERKEEGKENTWIIKPWNMARSKYIYVTDNLAMITKLAYTSPKVGHGSVFKTKNDIGLLSYCFLPFDK